MVPLRVEDESGRSINLSKCIMVNYGQIMSVDRLNAEN